MAEIVGGFLVPHDPVMFVARDAAPADQAERVWGAFENCAERLAASGATTAVIVGNDHYMLFGTTCLPKYCIATGHVEGPLDQLPGLKREQIANNEALATAIAEHGAEFGFDWAVARSFTTDHAFSIPYQLIVQRAAELSGREIKAVPVYLASAVDPFITTHRARELGEQIRAAVLAFEGDDKVAFIGSGGISHWVGTKESGQVNEEFDRYIIDLCCTMNIDALVALGDDEILARGGNGAMEIRNFICAMAASGAARGELVEYQPVPAWVTGLGLIELRV
ncbi:protocatechuate 3,4-dioxygenase [Marinobacterium sp. D7]|uniref:DODA-type extradiol aromatic ring-opening family dioxygenase n=1 Tax=Marinobacterium ramblicola TaxID=2849041 RepID=UPI001C2D6830|nr:protocatechuate 3,4-dioxygenase [Marinobacterium ramblicola]MBV1788643.1 protocatechuate 3,4-dioxygenase [Marinobacterium ramblicola]